MSESEINEMKPLPAPVVKPAQHPGRSPWPVLFGVLAVLGFGALAAGEAYLWNNQRAHQADATELAVLQAQLADLRSEAAKAGPAPDSVVVQADLAQKYATLAATLSAVQAQVAADHGALSQVQANATDLGKLTARISLLNELETARMALDAGQPLGQIPNAPPALAQYAAEPPPTEAALRESFAPAAKAAEAASISGNGRVGFWTGVKMRLEGFITISNGGHVLFGPPAAAALAAAQTALEAGDLAGAVAQLQSLSPGERQAMGAWLVQAQGLLAARAALVAMAQAA